MTTRWDVSLGEPDEHLGINVRCAASAEEAFAIIDDGYAVRRAVV
ncbi:MAG: hypothetical protein ACLR9W_02150 [Enterobacter hormaechei]